MKSFRFHSLQEQIEMWRQKLSDRHLVCSSCETNSSSYPKISGLQTNLENKKNSRINTSANHLTQARPPLIVALAIASLTSVVGARSFDRPKLDVGTVSPQKIYAPRSDRFSDPKTTEEKRREMRNAVVPTLKRDWERSQKLREEVAELLDKLDRIKRLSGNFPFVEPSLISLPTQRYLRQCSDKQWQSILGLVEDNPSVDNPAAKSAAIDRSAAELKNYLQQVEKPQFENLLFKIFLSRQAYAQVLEQLAREGIDLDFRTTILEIPEATWQESKKAILQATERILTQGIPSGLPDRLIKETIEIQLKGEVPDETNSLAAALLLEILQDKSNLTEDKEETKRLAEQAAQKVIPVVVEVERGELIVDAGQTIAQREFILLDGFDLSRRGINWSGLAKSAIIVSTAVGIFVLVKGRVHRKMRCRDQILLCLLSVSTPLLVIFDVPYTNLPAVGLLVSSFYSPTLAVTQVSLLTGLVAFSNESPNWACLISGSAGGILAAMVAGRLHSREELAMLGGSIGFTQAGVYLIVNPIVSASAATIWNILLPEAIICGLSGIAWVIVALGISPYLERFFDLVTPIRLAELCNPNRPLLKRLATEAPGTFQHTMFVASLAEAAARDLHCNVELVRAGTLYHDIGKMHDPLGFIENQMGGPNKHDRINNPWISAEIIKKHVTEGSVMARKYGLPKAVRDFIPEHQGTLLISYFYFQAKQRAQAEGKEVLDTDFRYDGPIPQSRETGIMMLADGCEAALRSLKDATPEIALSMMSKIFKARWEDGQLADSGIRREELPIIGKVFVRVWQEYNHQRIAYPKAALEASRTERCRS
jgi:putative nucleotidyltransferase with HDIG domain